MARFRRHVQVPRLPKTFEGKAVRVFQSTSRECVALPGRHGTGRAFDPDSLGLTSISGVSWTGALRR